MGELKQDMINMENTPLVSVVVLNWNGKDDTTELLDSLRKTAYKNYEVIVVDQGSLDGSVNVIRNKFRDVKIIQNEKNAGFAAGNNIGMENGRGDYFFLMNNDMVVHKDWLSELVKVAESNKEFGIVGSMILFYDKPDTIDRLGSIESNRITGAVTPYARDIKDIGQFTEPLETHFLNGLIRRDVIEKIGSYDEKMFAGGFEEVDFCSRARKAGYKTIVVPTSKLWHKGSRTIKRGSYFLIFNSYKNKLRYIIKNYGMLEKILALSFNLVYYSFKVFNFLLQMRPDLSKAMINAVLWNIKNYRDYL